LALKDGYRDKAVLATKNPTWQVEKYGDFEKFLDEELKRLGTDCIDVYLLHNLEYLNWQKVKKLDAFTFLDKMVQKGKIKHKAFSFHGTAAAFKEIVDAYDWEMAQIQLNILDEFEQAGVEGLKYASDKGLAVVIMEPLRGGYILNNIPENVQKLIDTYPKKHSLLEWCFRWLYNMPEATVVLSGTSSIEQLKQNIEIFSKAESNVMSAEDLEFIRKIREAFEAKKSIGCTGCRYCMPCPQNVDIPQIFKLYNSANLMSEHWVDKEMYTNNIMPSGLGADKCIECGLCMKHCPQGLKIPERLKEAHKGLME
jgi:predicted aldo/keto reductase-like oxidoreductase